MHERKEFTLVGLPWKYFLVVALIVLAAGFITYGEDSSKILLPKNMIGAFAFMAVAGAILNELGNRLPIIKTYLGGGPIVIIFGMAYLNYAKILPAATATTISDFMSKFAFLDWYIAALITGSILGMSRKLLIKASGRYVPAILAGVAVALGLVGLVGGITGFGWKQAVLFIGVPIMGGGMGAGAVPLSSIYGGSLGQDPASLLSMMIPAVALGNAMAIVAAGLLNRLGKAKPQHTGNGQLMIVKDDSILKSDTQDRAALKLETLGTGLLLAGTFYIIGLFLGQLNTMLLPAFQVHSFAWMIISVALVKASGLLPARFEDAAYQWFRFIMTNFTGVLLVGIGVSYTNLGQIISAFTPTYLLLVFTVILGAVIGTWFVGRMVGFYPIESSITAGLCMANMGGTGDVATLGAADRMELMPFAQISSRIGGAMMLILATLLISALL